MGSVKFLPLAEEHESQVGRVNGLAWTAAGGEVLDTEAITIKGKGNLILTGQLGDVMKESAETAYTYIRSRAKELGLVENFYETLDTHIHLPEGAVPKDGPFRGDYHGHCDGIRLHRTESQRRYRHDRRNYPHRRSPSHRRSERESSCRQPIRDQADPAS